MILPSGSELKVGVAPFSDAKALYQAILKAAKTVHVGDKDEIANVMKDAFCALLSSSEVEDAIWKCMGRCLYDGKKITPETFEPVDARQDFGIVCYEVAKENVLPFAQPLYAEFSPLLGNLKKLLA